MQVAGSDLAAIEREVETARSRIISDSSRESYLSSTVRFLQWMVRFKRSLVCDDFVNSLCLDSDGCPTRESVKSTLRSAPMNPPLHFDQINARDFMTWIMSMKKRDGSFHVFQTYSGHRSAFVNLFRDYHSTMSPELALELSNHFKGLQNLVTEAVSSGSGDIKVGKDPMELSLYKRISQHMLFSGSRDMVFARAFMVMSWNLMARAANTVSICYSHLEWKDDALCVYFAHMKNDQRGTRQRDPRHVYANPLVPELCPLLALGIYWAVYDFSSSDPHLFPGRGQYERFRKVLGRVLASSSVAADLERRGTAASNIGTHSMRKGASTYCSSGSTACPPAIAVHLRAGWALGGVQDRYLRHDAAGDMYVGRTVSGLPIQKPEFAVLPPRFVSDDKAVREGKLLCFGILPESVSHVSEMALASLMYHYEFLRANLAETHPLFQTALFTQPNLVCRLRSAVRRDLFDGDDMTATGIPPHVTLLAAVDQLRSDCAKDKEERKRERQELIDLHERFHDRIISSITETLEERAVTSGVPTCDRLATTILQRLESAGLLGRLGREVEANEPNSDNDALIEVVTENDTALLNDNIPQYTLHCWEERFHAFPMNTKLPSCTPKQAWIYWCCGDPSKQLPPFRTMEPNDLNIDNQRKRLSDLKYLMCKVERRASELGINYRNLTPIDAGMVFEQCESAIQLPLETTRERKRRRGQLVWLSVTSELRKRARLVGENHVTVTNTTHQT